MTATVLNSRVILDSCIEDYNEKIAEIIQKAEKKLLRKIEINGDFEDEYSKLDYLGELIEDEIKFRFNVDNISQIMSTPQWQEKYLEVHCYE